jgi:dTDP-4-amino-4,6-dideoxygalactose transaminase
MTTIPVFEPVISPDEIEAVLQAIQRGEISGSFGESSRNLKKSFLHILVVIMVSPSTAARQHFN